MPASRSDDPPSVRPIGARYRILGLLGRGGMGSVYRVRDAARSTHLALKRLEMTGASESDRLRFRREFHTLAQLKHPGVVEVFEYGIDEQGPFYTMELLEGQDLYELGPLPLERALKVLREVAETLAFLHSRRLVHRDIAPRNIRFDGQGRAKLLDFGILATVGTLGEVAGTPPYMAPESLRGLPLDHRADLFGLGALAYRLLTGRHAYPAKLFGELEALWSRPVPPPSSVAAGVPQEVDRLVQSLLSVDPLRRPRSAAEVVDRLGAVVGGSAPSGHEVAEGYLASTVLVGRQRELATLRRSVELAVGGKGEALVIEGPPGSGKTRLLRELGLEAQLAGALVLNARAESSSRASYGVMRELIRGLFAVAPGEAAQAAEGRLVELARLPELAESLGTPVPPPLADGTEERLRLHSALCDWLLAVSERKPLVLLVDDAYACDEASAALLVRLAALAPKHRLLVALGCVSDQPARALEALATLRRSASRLKLRGLEEPEVEELLKATFGEGAWLKRLARWMHPMSGGSPLHVAELARHLVERGVIRYDSGLWVLGDTLPEEVPRALVAALEARIAELPRNARSLAEVICVHEGSVPLELCVRLAVEPDEAVVFSTLDELVQRDVLVGDGGSYRFRHAALRDAFVRGLSLDRQRALHLLVARTLQGMAVPSDRDAEVGFHLLLGGEEAEGAVLLEGAGRRLFEARSFADALEPLEAAVKVYEQTGTSPRAILELRYMLLFCGSIADRDVAVRYAEPAMQGLFEAAGLDLAQRLRRWIGPTLALFMGLARAGLRWLRAPRERRPMPPLQALITFFLAAGSAATVSALLNDVDSLRRLIARVEPVVVARKGLPYSLLLFFRNLQEFALGRWGELRRNATEALEALHADRSRGIPELQKRIAEACLRIQLALAAVEQQQPGEFAQEVGALERLDLRMFDGHVASVRAFFHRIRGEEEQALEFDARAELLFLQLGSVWGAEVQRAATAGLCYGLTRDVLGLKRVIEDLSRLVRSGVHFGFLLEATRGEYHRERGEFVESEADLLRALDQAPPGFRQSMLAALAETHLAAGEVRAAQARALEAVGCGRNPDIVHVVPGYRSERVLALAEAATGEVPAAVRRLEALAVDAARTDNPLLVGMVQEARATVALIGGDAAAYRGACQEMERAYGQTRNPVLLARAQRLVDLGAVRSVPAAELAAEVVTVVRQHEGPGAAALLAECRGAAERAARALEILVWEGGGANGFLYLVRDGRPVLVAPTHGEEPPDEVGRAVSGLVEAARAGQTSTLQERVLQVKADGPRWFPLPLTVSTGGLEEVMGAVVISEGALRFREVPIQVLKDVAQALWQAGDATAARARSA